MHFFFTDAPPPEIYTLSLHDALPISIARERRRVLADLVALAKPRVVLMILVRSEEHTSELQSLTNLVCRLLLEKKKKTEMKFHILEKKKIRFVTFASITVTKYSLST